MSDTFKKLLAAVLLVWLICLFAGSFFGILGKVIWIAILGTAIAAIWGYLKRDEL